MTSTSIRVDARPAWVEFPCARQYFGWGPRVKVVTVVLTAALFAMAHLREQGLAGAEQAFVTGMVFGGIFALTGSIWPVMVMHAAFDVAVLMIYFDLERPLAQLFFR